MNKKTRLYQENYQPDEFNMVYVLQKPRILTYLAFVLCPPYGLWRLFKSPTSELFRSSEKVVWTLIETVYISQLIQWLFLT